MRKKRRGRQKEHEKDEKRERERERERALVSAWRISNGVVLKALVAAQSPSLRMGSRRSQWFAAPDK